MIKDAGLKIDAMGLLWGLGYVVRPEVVIAQSKRRNTKDSYIDITDIDVLGYMFSPLLRMDSVAIDCGSGTSRGISERILWMRGLMEAANITSSVCVLGKQAKEEQRFAAERLGIRLVSAADFPAFKQALLGGGETTDFTNYYKIYNDWVTYLSQNDEGFSSYLLKEHWDREWDRVPIQLPAQVRKWNVRLKAEKNIHGFALLELAILLSLGLVRMALHMCVTKPADLRSAVISYVMGGEKRLKLVDMLMHRLDELEHVVVQQNSLPGISAPPRNGLSSEIPFSNELLDVTARLINRPMAARHVPRCIQAFQIAHVAGDARRFEEFVGSEVDSMVVKLSLDVIKYMSTAGNAREDVLAILGGI